MSIVPKLTELGSHQKWLASADQKQLSTSMRSTWHEHRKQKRWLLKNHPEAALQDEVLGEILNLEISPRQHTRMAEWQFTQFAVGEMTDISNQQQKITGAPLLAMAAGSAGDTLRIVRPSTNFWSLGEGEGEPVRLLEHAAHQETLWTKDIGTIRCIQAVVSTKRFDPVRWLVVQRASSTSVFRPEYRKVPVVSETFSGTGPQAPSHIAPNLLFKISTTQTGVNPHCDASFNPGIRSAPAQLAIMDEGGNWTIWEISGTRKKVTKHPKAQLRKCGNIHKGVRDRPSSRAAAKPQWHAIFWVGRAPTHDAEDEFDEGEMAADEAASSFPTLKRSSILLLCNRKLLRLLDLETNQFLPDFHFMSTESKDLILDVQVDKEDSRYFYVVTTSRLFILAVLTTVDAVDGLLTKKVLILQSFPHLRSKLDRNLKVTIADGATSSTGRTVHVILYSQYSSWYDVFYIRYSRQFPEQIVCHHGSLLSRDIASKAVNGGLQTLCVTPTPILLRQSDGGFDAHRVYFGGEERYFQFFSFGADLDLSYCLGSSSTVIWRKGVLTTRRVAETELISGARPKSRPHIAKLEKYSRQKVEREKAVRYLATRFIVADSVAEFRYRDDIITASVKAATTSNQPTKLLSRMVAPVHEQFHDMLRKLWPKNDRSKEVAIFGAAPFDPVFVAFQEALETKSLPLKTM